MDFQNKIIKQYEKQGYTVLKIIRLSDNGYPDLLCMKAGEIDTWIEIKGKGDTLKPLQALRIEQLKQLGKNAFVLYENQQ